MAALAQADRLAGRGLRLAERVPLVLERAALEHLRERGLELLLLEGLVQVVDGAQAHGLDDGSGLAHHREHHDRHLGMLGADARERREAVLPRHHHVEQHDVGRGAALEQRERAAPVLGGVDVEAAQLEQVGHEGPDALGVVDDENARGAPTLSPRRSADFAPGRLRACATASAPTRAGRGPPRAA